jgi:hypothetical protein
MMKGNPNGIGFMNTISKFGLAAPAANSSPMAPTLQMPMSIAQDFMNQLGLYGQAQPALPTTPEQQAQDFMNQLGLYGQGDGQPTLPQTQAQLPNLSNIAQQLQFSPEQQQYLQQMQNDPMLQYQMSPQNEQYEQQLRSLQNQLQGLPQYQQMDALSRQIGQGRPTPEQQQQMQQLQQQLQSSPVYSQMRALNQQQQSGYADYLNSLQGNALGTATAAPQPDVFATSPAVRRPPMIPTGPRGVSSRRREPGQVRTQVGRGGNEDRDNGGEDRIRPLSGVRGEEMRGRYGMERPDFQRPQRGAGQQMPSRMNDYMSRLNQLRSGPQPTAPGMSGIGSLFNALRGRRR